MPEQQDSENQVNQQPQDNGQGNPVTHKTRTFGNKAFDWMVWPAVQWIGVWGLSLFLANKAQNGKGILNKWYKDGVNWLTPKFKAFDSPTAKKIWGQDTDSKQWAGALALFTALFMGGNLSLPVLKFFEDRRERISSWFDKVFHKTPQSPEEIAKEPRQTWGSIIKGRLGATILGYSVFFGLGPGKATQVQNVVGGAAADVFMKMRPQADRTTVRKWADLAVFDLLFTAIAASVHFFTSRIFARKEQENNMNIPDNSGIMTDNQQDMAGPVYRNTSRELKNTQIQPKYASGWTEGENARKQAEAHTIGAAP